MAVYSEIPLPEEIGQDTLLATTLRGVLVNIHGDPISAPVKISLNKRVSKYKTKTNVNGDEREILSDENNGEWSLDLPDTSNMTLDTYYHITINDQVFLKTLPDFPPSVTLNELEDY